MAKQVHGLQNVLDNIHREIMAIRGRTYKGMMEAMRYLENRMDTERPLVPIRTKAMRDSWFISGDAHHVNPVVHAGYTVHYAPIVHENVTAVNWTLAGSGPKWLQIHYDRSRRDMYLIVAQHARVRGSSISRVNLPAESEYVDIGSRTTERFVEF